jgi:hypothetical protein
MAFHQGGRIGFPPELAQHCQIPLSDILDTALFSWHSNKGWRFAVLEDDFAEPSDAAAKDPSFLKSASTWSSTMLAIKANFGHSIELA